MNETTDFRPHGCLTPFDSTREARRQRAKEVFEERLSYRRVAYEPNLPKRTVRDREREWRKGRFNVVPTERAYGEDFRRLVLPDVNGRKGFCEVAKRRGISYSSVKKVV